MLCWSFVMGVMSKRLSRGSASCCVIWRSGSTRICCKAKIFILKGSNQYRSLLAEEFHRLADTTLECLQERLEEYGDSIQLDGFDIDYGTSAEVDFFTEYGEGSRYKIEEVIGKGSYGVVCSAYDTHTGDKVAIKKINDIFEHVSDATHIKLLRLLRHPDIVEIKHILLPPSRREFKDIYVVFELMESDLHQVIKANDDLTLEHYQFFLYQLLRGLKYIHTDEKAP